MTGAADSLAGLGVSGVPATRTHTYEAGVWRVPDPTTTNAPLVRKIREGTATASDLMMGGATQLGTRSDDYGPCSGNGQSCAGDIYAVSLPSEVPSAFITWFQALEACAN